MADTLASPGVIAAHPNHKRINSVIAKAKASGKCPPVVEGVWRAIGEADISALESLAANTPENTVIRTSGVHTKMAAEICYTAERGVDKLLNPIVIKLMAARSAVAAFNECGMSSSESSVSKKVHWPSLMDALELIIPTDDELDTANQAIYKIVESAVSSALAAAVVGTLQPVAAD